MAVSSDLKRIDVDVGATGHIYLIAAGIAINLRARTGLV
jgi:hypothetical protein